MKTKRSGVSAQANARVGGRYAAARQLACIAFLIAAPVAFGHGGEDHGAPPPPVVSQSAAPRAIAASEEFEAVAVLEGKKLVIYLDRFASNEPVAGARVEIDGGGLKGVAAELSPGVYGIDAAALAAAKHPLTIAIETGDSADLLSATLDVAPAQAAVGHVHGWSEWWVWLGAALVALAASVLLALRRGKQRKGRK